MSPRIAQHLQNTGPRGRFAYRAVEIFGSEFWREIIPRSPKKVLERGKPLLRSYNGLLLRFKKNTERRTVTKERLRKLMLYSAVAFEFERADPPNGMRGSVESVTTFYFLTPISISKHSASSPPWKNRRTGQHGCRGGLFPAVRSFFPRAVPRAAGRGKTTSRLGCNVGSL